MTELKIRDKVIPVIIRDYKTSKHVKFYYRSNVLNISKPKRLSMAKLKEIIQKNEEFIYREYIKIISKESNCIKHWVTGEKIFYKGIEHKIVVSNSVNKRTYINVEEDNFKIVIPEEIDNLEETSRKKYIDKIIKKFFKEETFKMLEIRVPYWSEYTKINYKNFKVQDAVSRYGSCIPKTKELHFSSRLIMLPIEQVDCVIVHELCHIIHANHSKDFYDLINNFMPYYKERTKWLKNNNKILAI